MLCMLLLHKMSLLSWFSSSLSFATFPRCDKDAIPYIKVSLTWYLNWFKSGVNRHFKIFELLLIGCSICFFSLLLFVTLCFVNIEQPRKEWRVFESTDLRIPFMVLHFQNNYRKLERSDLLFSINEQMRFPRSLYFMVYLQGSFLMVQSSKLNIKLRISYNKKFRMVSLINFAKTWFSFMNSTNIYKYLLGYLKSSKITQ